MEIKFKKSPGLLYDTITMLILKLNAKKKWVSSAINTNHEEADLAYFQYWMDQFEIPDERLYLMFYRKDARTLSFFVSFFKKILEKYEFNLDIEDLFLELSDTDSIRQQVLTFYLKREVPTQPHSSLSEEIHQCQHISNTLKFSLLNFALNTEIYISSLKKWFLSYYNQLKVYYHEKAYELLAIQDTIQQEQIEAGYSLYTASCSKQDKKIFTSSSPLYVSICLISKNVFWMKLYERYAWCILGQNYSETLQMNQNFHISPAILGNAIGDPTREQILQLILESGEQTSSDISKKLGLALNTISYHIDILKKAHLLCYQNRGKSTYYWLNTRTCEEAARMFKNWSKGYIYET